MSYTPLDESLATNGGSRISHGPVVFHEDDSSQPISPSATSNGNLRQELSEPLTRSGDDQDDPFYVFRDDLYRKLELVDESLAEFLRLVYQSNSSSSSTQLELKNSKKQLKKHTKSAEATLRDVQMTVQVVENDRANFPHISDVELYERTAFVHTSRERLNRAKQETQSESVKAKLLQDERQHQRSTTVKDAQQNGDAAAFLGDTQARQSLLMEHQDETLDELGVAVTRVNSMAGNINEEIGQQNKMLTEMEDDLANAEEELGMVMGKLAKFMKTKNQWQLGTILCLSATVVVLFFMVLYF